MLNVYETGAGRPVLLIHGGAEDADLLAPQAHALATHGFRALWYDRRGTGAGPRTDWPGTGADQHADDAARVLRDRTAGDATVLGFSSGGTVALALAARHPSVAAEVIAWEPAALGVLPDGPALHAEMVAPIDAHLAAHPGDWVGAFRVALTVISGGAADLSSPEVRRMERNAEAVIRDDSALITARGFAPGELPATGLITVATCADPNPLHAAIATIVGELIGRPPVVADKAHDHEVYLSDPSILADFLAARALTHG